MNIQWKATESDHQIMSFTDSPETVPHLVCLLRQIIKTKNKRKPSLGFASRLFVSGCSQTILLHAYARKLACCYHKIAFISRLAFVCRIRPTRNVWPYVALKLHLHPHPLKQEKLFWNTRKVIIRISILCKNFPPKSTSCALMRVKAFVLMWLSTLLLVCVCITWNIAGIGGGAGGGGGGLVLTWAESNKYKNCLRLMAWMWRQLSRMVVAAPYTLSVSWNIRE